MLPNKKTLQKNFFLDFGLFWPFFNQKTAKIDQKSRKLAKSKPFDEFFLLSWYVDASQQNKMLHKNLFWISAFFGRFLTKKQAKIAKDEENWLNPKHLVKFSEIWYLLD